VKKLDLTRVIVAHRSETIASADRVIKLAGGRIVSGLARTEGGPGRAGELSLRQRSAPIEAAAC